MVHTGAMTEQGRRCAYCRAPLDESSRSTRRYCAASCRVAANRERRRSNVNQATGGGARDEDVARLRRQVRHLEARLDHAHQQRERDRQAIRRAERRADRAEKQLQQQAQRIAETRNQNARITAQRDEARRQLGDAPCTAEEFQDVRRKLDEGRQAYRELRTQYGELVSTLDQVAAERKTLQSIVKDWGRMCARLAKVDDPQKLSAKDRDSVKMWQKFRESMKATEK